MKPNAFLAAVITGTCLLARPSWAESLYSTLGPADSYNGASGWVISGPTSLLGFQDIAAPFTPSTKAFLDSVQLALINTADSDEVFVRISADDGGLPNPTFLAQATILAPDVDSIVTAEFDDSLLLTDGVQYWLWLSTVDTGMTSWNLNDQGVLGFAINTGSGFTYQNELPAPAFRVNGIVASVPDSGPGVLLAAGVAGLLAWRRGRLA